MNSIDRVTSKSIITNKPYCLECGSYHSLELHHCIHGSNRKKADQDGLFVLLCTNCHKRLHSVSSELDLKYKRLAQKSYMKYHTLEEFMTRYHINYLWEVEDD